MEPQGRTHTGVGAWEVKIEKKIYGFRNRAEQTARALEMGERNHMVGCRSRETGGLITIRHVER